MPMGMLYIRHAHSRSKTWDEFWVINILAWVICISFYGFRNSYLLDVLE